MEIVEKRIDELVFRDIMPGMVFFSEGFYWLKTNDPIQNAIALTDGELEHFSENEIVTPYPTAKVIFD